MSDREAAVYDRAIRLWGAEAQKRLMTAKVLVYGIDGLAAEVSSLAAQSYERPRDCKGLQSVGSLRNVRFRSFARTLRCLASA
jgi:hypothetical protein